MSLLNSTRKLWGIGRLLSLGKRQVCRDPKSPGVSRSSAGRSDSTWPCCFGSRCYGRTSWPCILCPRCGTYRGWCAAVWSWPAEQRTIARWEAPERTRVRFAASPIRIPFGVSLPDAPTTKPVMNVSVWVIAVQPVYSRTWIKQQFVFIGITVLAEFIPFWSPQFKILSSMCDGSTSSATTLTLVLNFIYLWFT